MESSFTGLALHEAFALSDRQMQPGTSSSSSIVGAQASQLSSQLPRGDFRHCMPGVKAAATAGSRLSTIARGTAFPCGILEEHILSVSLLWGTQRPDWLAYDSACMQTMRRLTESRPVDTPRQEFFTDAEIFACIVTFHLVAASGGTSARPQHSGPCCTLLLHLVLLMIMPPELQLLCMISDEG